MDRIVLVDPSSVEPEVPPGHWSVHARDILSMAPIRVQLCEMFPGGGAEPHLHPRQDQLFIVIDGRLEVEGEAEPPVAVDSGQAVLIPAGVRHGTNNVSDSPARYIVITYGLRDS